MAGLTGLEPATSCVTGRRSNQAELQPQAGKGKSGRNFHRLVTFGPKAAPLKGSETRWHNTKALSFSQAKRGGKAFKTGLFISYIRKLVEALIRLQIFPAGTFSPSSGT